MRKVYIVDHDFPPTPDDLAAAEAAGAPETLCGIPEALVRAGISTFGYHEVADPVPTVVSARQAQLALSQAGKYAQVKAAVDAADEETQIWFNTSRDWERQNDVLRRVQESLGWSDADVDGLFIAAAALP